MEPRRPLLLVRRVERRRLAGTLAVVVPVGWVVICLGASVPVEGAAEVVGPLVGDLPWDEVSAVVVGGDVDVLVPGGVLVAIIPARSAWDGTMIHHWCRWYDRVRVWKFPDRTSPED